MESYQAKNIVSKFLNCSVNEINSKTDIRQSKLGGSILTARMYSELSRIGLKISNYWGIKTFGELENHLGIDVSFNPENLPFIKSTTGISESNREIKTSNPIGIDIELINNLPNCNDYWTDEFYSSNFTNNEISYCLLKENPKESFAGKYAAKEAVKKILSSSQNISLKEIEILNRKDGVPYYNDEISISISHTNDYVTAVAILKSDNLYGPKETLIQEEDKDSNENKIEVKYDFKKRIELFLLIISVIINFLYFEHIIK